MIWDQEIYDSFSYNHDRTFFHTFELEECLAGLSFADEKEAKTFRKKIEDREKNAHRNTRLRPFTATSGSVVPSSVTDGDKHHSRLGSLFGYRHSGGHHEHSSSNVSAEASYAASSESISPQNRNPAVNISDPSIQSLLTELKDLGITEDQIQGNADFINSYIRERRKGMEREAAENADRRQRAPPPPPPAQTTSDYDRIKHSTSVSSHDTASSASGSRRGPPPAPPPARRTVTTQRQSSPVRPEMHQTQTSPTSGLSPTRFRAPPPIADAGKFAQVGDNMAKARNASSPAASAAAPPPPPRPPKVALGEQEAAVKPANAPINQIPPSKGSVPPPPPMREPPPSIPPPASTTSAPALPKFSNQAVPAAPPLPAASPAPGNAPIASRSEAPPAPPLPPVSAPSSAARPPPSIPNAPPPPVREPQAPPPAPAPVISPPFPSQEPQIPPPPPSSGAPPPPAPPPPAPPMPPPAPILPPAPASKKSDASEPPQPLPAADPGRGTLLADIRGGARLKKVSDAEKRDRSAAMVPGSGSNGPSSAPGASSSGGGGADGGLAGALASALAARKSKVSHSGMYTLIMS